MKLLNPKLRLRSVMLAASILLFSFNTTQGSQPLNKTLAHPIYTVERIIPKKIKIDMADIVRNESCVSIPDHIPDSHLIVLYKSSVRYKIPIRIITKLISIESDWVEDTSSSCGAFGYGQIMPSTKRHIARELGEKVKKDPKQDIRFTVVYLREMLDDAHGDMRLALAYYNAGPTKIHRYGTRVTRKYTNAIMNCNNEKDNQ